MVVTLILLACLAVLFLATFLGVYVLIHVLQAALVVWALCWVVKKIDELFNKKG